MEKKYNQTVYACFSSYIVQAIVNHFVPLLFLTFQKEYHIPLAQITLLVTFNFGIQLLIDLVSISFIDKIGYRLSMILAHIFSALGLILLTFLPEIVPSPFAGILISVMIYAIGGGLLEVLVSPIVESCPSQNKEKAMSMLHSFYCWGHVGVILFSTVFFTVFGIEHWKLLMLIWALLPIGNAFAFIKVPIAPLLKGNDTALNLSGLLKNHTFWLLSLMMICAGASEHAISQWASAFAESSLNISKTIGDLIGPMGFAFLMGISRLFYGKYGDKIKLEKFMIFSALLCMLSYLGVSLFPIPILSLLCCALCGLSVGIMWPGAISTASSLIPRGGTSMFALLALGGDLGCSGGPTLVGMISDRFGGNLKIGILIAVIFPLLLVLTLLRCHKMMKSANT